MSWAGLGFSWALLAFTPLLGCAREPATSAVDRSARPVASMVSPPIDPGPPAVVIPASDPQGPFACEPDSLFPEAEMWKALPPHDPHGPMEVLVWDRRVDERPWAVDAVVVWFQYSTDSKTRAYKLAHLYRNPHFQGDRGAEWHVSMAYDVPDFRGADNYDHPPTSAEIRSFLGDTMWEFTTSPSWKSLGSGVCRETWARVTGEPAPRLP